MINILFSKKGFLIGGILLFLFLLIFFFFLLSSKRSQAGSSVPIVAASPKSSIKNKTTEALTENLNTYKAVDYIIKYPRDWKTDVSATSEGSMVLLHPNVLTSGDSYPGLFIFTIDKLATSFEEREKLYTKLGYIKTTQIIDGAEAIKLQGKIPFKVINGKAEQASVQETNILVQSKNKEYLFKYHYISETKDQKMEDTFMKIINSFHKN